MKSFPSSSTIVEQIVPALVGYGVNSAMEYLSGDKKSYQPTALPNIASPQGPVFYGPGGAGRRATNYASNLPPGFPPRRRRRGRRRGRRRRAKSGRTKRGRNQMTSMAMPVSYSDSICNLESMFNVSPTRNTSHGPVASVAFSGMLCNLGTNMIVLRNDYQNAISMNGVNGSNVGTQQIASGFLSSDGNWASGLICYPAYFSRRLYREFYNWTEYRPRKLTFRYQNAQPTSAPGLFLAAFSRDPNDFFEATDSGTFAAATHAPGQVAETIPNCTSNIYRDFGFQVSRFDPNQWYKCEYSRSNPTVAGNDSGTVSLARQSAFGRICVLYNGPTGLPSIPNAGTLWVSGVLDLAGPTSSGLLIPTTQATSGLLGSTSIDSKHAIDLSMCYLDGKFAPVSKHRESMSSSSHSDQVILPDKPDSKTKPSPRIPDAWEDIGTS